jgi:ankyrin repeat protein
MKRDQQKKNNPITAELLTAIERRSLPDALRCLAAPDVDVNAKTEDLDRIPALTLAVMHQQAPIVDALILNDKIDPNATDSKHLTALQLAVLYNRPDLVQLLLKNPRTDPNVQNARCEDGRAAIHMAVLVDSPEVVSLLVDDNRTRGRAKDNYHNEAIHYITTEGNSQCGTITNILIGSKKIEVNASNSIGVTTLHTAAKQGNDLVVRALLRAPTLNVNPIASNGVRPLHLAAENNHASTVQLLIGARSDVNAQDTEGRTPLHLAVFNNRKAIVSIFLPLPGIDLRIKDKKGYMVGEVAKYLKDNTILNMIVTELNNRERTLFLEMEGETRVKFVLQQVAGFKQLQQQCSSAMESIKNDIKQAQDRALLAAQTEIKDRHKRQRDEFALEEINDRLIMHDKQESLNRGIIEQNGLLFFDKLKSSERSSRQIVLQQAKDFIQREQERDFIFLEQLQQFQDSERATRAMIVDAAQHDYQVNIEAMRRTLNDQQLLTQAASSRQEVSLHQPIGPVILNKSFQSLFNHVNGLPFYYKETSKASCFDVYIVGSCVEKILKQHTLDYRQDIDFVIIPRTTHPENTYLEISPENLTSLQIRKSPHVLDLYTQLFFTADLGMRKLDLKIASNDPNIDYLTRDFTMNAVYLSANGNILDPSGQGITDMKNRTLNTILDAHLSLRIYPVRILRAVKYVVSQGYTFSKEVSDAINNWSGEIYPFLCPHFFRVMQRHLKVLDQDRYYDVLKRLGLTEKIERVFEGFQRMNVPSVTNDTDNTHDSLVTDVSSFFKHYKHPPAQDLNSRFAPR